MNEKCELFLGDCLNYMKTMKDNSVDLVLTDPPYNIGKKFDNDNLNKKEFELFTKNYLREIKRISKNKKPILIFFNTGESLADFISIAKEILKFKKYINWYKPNDCSFPLGSVLRKSEALLLFSKEGALSYKSDKNIHDCLIFNKIIRDRTFWHPTVKELPLLETIILAFSKEGDLVFDPFIGSGTTGVAALKLKRNFIGCEINKEYFEIAKKRIGEWEKQKRLF